jgi:hypothetical protein
MDLETMALKLDDCPDIWHSGQVVFDAYRLNDLMRSEGHSV